MNQIKKSNPAEALHFLQHDVTKSPAGQLTMETDKVTLKLTKFILTGVKNCSR